MRRTGRPVLAANTARDLYLHTRVSPDERAAIGQLAHSANRSVSEFVRLAVFGARIEVVQTMALDPLMRHDLARIGNNLNQIARIMNATGEPRRTDTLERAISDLQALLTKAVRDELRQG